MVLYFKFSINYLQRMYFPIIGNFPKANSTILSIDNTRPISLLPCLSKVYERCFLIHLHKWMNNNGILPPEQSGFRHSHSTTTRFIHFLQDVTAGLLQHSATLVLYIDLTKAFNHLWHDGLLFKLYQIYCPRELVQLIIQYLKNRRCYIQFDNLTSDIFNIEKGVPQDSCLGPILFLLFHFTLPQELIFATHTHMYAGNLAIIITPSPSWSRTAFQTNMQYLDQRTLNQIQLYAATWKNLLIHGNQSISGFIVALLFQLLLSQSTNNPLPVLSLLNILAFTLMTNYHSTNIASKCFVKFILTRQY